MNYKYTMGKITGLFLSLRCFLSVWIAFSLLSVSFLNINIDISSEMKSDIGNICQATSMSDYYKFITDIPIKLVSKFILINTDSSCGVPDKQNKKEKENKNGKNTVFIITSDSNSLKMVNPLNILYKEVVNYSGYPIKFENNSNCFVPLIFIFALMLLASGMLARGNIEDNINNNMNKVRLVL